jgi:hypothetical protein
MSFKDGRDFGDLSQTRKGYFCWLFMPKNIYRGALEAGAFLNQGINTTKQFGNKLKNPLTKNIKTKKPIIYEEQIDIPLFDELINEAQKLKNVDLQIKEIYENIKEGEGWKYPGVNISKEMYEKALDNLENSVIYRGVGNSKIVPDKISLPASNDPIFAKRPEGNASRQRTSPRLRSEKAGPRLQSAWRLLVLQGPG